MSLTNLNPKPEWFHGQDITGFRLGQIPYFSASEIAAKLGVAVTGDFDQASFFLLYQPLVMFDRSLRNEEHGEVFMPIPAIYSWLFSRDQEKMTENGKRWLSAVLADCNEIINSSPEMQELTADLFREIGVSVDH